MFEGDITGDKRPAFVSTVDERLFALSRLYTSLVATDVLMRSTRSKSAEREEECDLDLVCDIGETLYDSECFLLVSGM